MKVVLLTNNESGVTVLASPCPECAALVTEDMQQLHKEYHAHIVSAMQLAAGFSGGGKYVVSVEGKL